ncbi:MAG: hypothetical protein Q8L34_05015 [Candidatus Woesearchaeota archaeon]|nr:hypothetical protein [Candidatus Woesearchaeota archaeon]
MKQALSLNMRREFVDLKRKELSDLLAFLGENPQSIFETIEFSQIPGWLSTVVTGGRYRVTISPQATTYDVRVNYLTSNIVAEHFATRERASLQIKKTIPYKKT